MLIQACMDAARLTCATIILAGALTAGKTPIAEAQYGETWPILLGRYGKIHLPLMMAIAYGISGGAPHFAELLAPALLLAIIATGIALRRLRIIGDCNCHGGLAKTASNTGTALTGLLAFCAALAFTNAVGMVAISTTRGGGGSPYVFLASIVLAGAWVLISGKDQPESAASAGNEARAPSRHGRVFPYDLVVGRDANRNLTIADLCSRTPLTAFIGVSQTCTACELAKPVYLGLAKAFPGNLNIVFLADTVPLDHPSDGGPAILAMSAEFHQSLGITEYPFGLIVKSAGFRQVGDIKVSSTAVWEMLFTALAVLLKRRMPQAAGSVG